LIFLLAAQELNRGTANEKPLEETFCAVFFTV
jgi:hypothetical protein